jgi:hypothetical protein
VEIKNSAELLAEVFSLSTSINTGLQPRPAETPVKESQAAVQHAKPLQFTTPLADARLGPAHQQTSLGLTILLAADPAHCERSSHHILFFVFARALIIGPHH